MQMVGADRLALVVPAEGVPHFVDALVAQLERLQSLQAHGMTLGQQNMAFGPQRQQQLPPPMPQQVCILWAASMAFVFHPLAHLPSVILQPTLGMAGNPLHLQLTLEQTRCPCM